MVTSVENHIKTQFPSLYREEGEGLVAFMEAYYEFLDEYNYTQNRDLQALSNIDETVDIFIDHFRKTYLDGFPYVSTTDTKFMVKNIMDYYRSKGSEKSLKLLMQILFGEEIEVNYPRENIFKASDSKWVQPVYIEMSANPRSKTFVGKKIIGSLSNSSAIAEGVVRKRSGGKLIDILYLSRVSGNFVYGERITDNGVVQNAPKVIGSLNEIDISEGGFGHNVGDILTVNSSNGSQAKVRVSETQVIDRTINFEIQDSGYGYTLDENTSITITPRGSGSGASFKIGSLKDTSIVEVNTDLIAPFVNTPLNGSFGFEKDTGANLDTIIADGLSYNAIEIGAIDTLTAISTGSNYDSDVDVEIKNPSIMTYNVQDVEITLSNVNGSFRNGETIVSQDDEEVKGIVTRSLGGLRIYIKMRSINSRFKDGMTIRGSDIGGTATIRNVRTVSNSEVMGNNAVVTGRAQSLEGKVSKVAIVSSGFGYTPGEFLNLYNKDNVSSIVTGNAIVDKMGFGEGFWKTKTSHLNSGNRIRDNDYYQEFSYEIVAGISLDRYEDIVKKLFHPAGMKMFGRTSIATIIDNNQIGFRTDVLESVDASSTFITVDNTYITADISN